MAKKDRKVTSINQNPYIFIKGDTIMYKYLLLITILLSILIISCDKQQTGKMANLIGGTGNPVTEEPQTETEPTTETVIEEPPPINFEPNIIPQDLPGVLPGDNIVLADELPADVTIFETIKEMYDDPNVKGWFKVAEQWIGEVCRGERDRWKDRPKMYVYFTTREVRNSLETALPGENPDPEKDKDYWFARRETFIVQDTVYYRLNVQPIGITSIMCK